MTRLSDLQDQLKCREEHRFCKQLLAEKRKKYKCPQRRIACLKNTDSWDIYIDPEGLVGNYRGCCRWEAMILALDDKFGTG